MRLLIIISFYIVFLSPSLAQNGKHYSLTGQSDSLFVEMVFFKKSDSILFYIFDSNMNHVAISEIKGHISFIFGKNALLTIKLDSSKYNKVQERIQMAIPKDYWENFKSCELYVPINKQMTKFTILNPKKEEAEKHQDMPMPGGHSH